MEQNKLPKNIRQIGEKEDWIRVYMEDYVHTYIQRLRGLQESGISGGVLLGKKQRINGVMHLFIRGAAVVEDPFWKTPGQTPGQMRAESSVYFPELEICGFFVSSRQNRSSEVELVRIFETYFPSEYQVLFNVRDQEEEVFSYSGHGLLKLAGYYIYYEKNEEMQSYIIRQESLRVLGKQGEEDEMSESSWNMEMSGRQAEKAEKQERTTGKNGKSRKSEKAARNGKGIFSGPEPVPDRRDSIKTDTGQNSSIRSSAKKKEVQAGKKSADKKKIRKGDMIVRAVSIAGIFILAFLLFSDQIKFSKLNDDSEGNSGILSSIISESQAVPAGADSSYITDGEQGSGTDALNGSVSEGDGAEGNGAEGDGAEGNGTEGDGAEGDGSESGGSGESVSEGTKNSSAEAVNGSAEESSDDSIKNEESEQAAATGGSETEKTESSSAQQVSGNYVFPLRYLVKKGDSLYSISEKYYGSTDMVDAICLENNIADPSALKYGTVLTLPAR